MLNFTFISENNEDLWFNISKSSRYFSCLFNTKELSLSVVNSAALSLQSAKHNSILEQFNFSKSLQTLIF